MNRRAALVALAAIALAVTTGAVSCRRGSSSPAGVSDAAAGAHRVVSLSPSTTEAMFAIGAGEKLVGRSRYCDYPEAAKRLPSVGGYVDPSFEAILGLAPDLVIGARGPSGRTLTDRLAERGIATYFPKAESMSEIDEMITTLGERVGEAASARALVTAMRAKRDAIASAVKDRPKPRVLLVFGIAPVVVAGPGGFPDEMLRMAGGDNVVKEGAAYPTLGFEHVLALDPDLVLDAAIAEGHDPGSGARIGPDVAGFRELRAVKQGHVIGLADESVLRPGPRVADGLAILARALHPEVAIP